MLAPATEKQNISKISDMSYRFSCSFLWHLLDIYNMSIEVEEKIVPTELRLSPIYIKVYLIYMNVIIHGILPFVTLFLLNISVYRKVRIFKNG